MSSHAQIGPQGAETNPGTDSELKGFKFNCVLVQAEVELWDSSGSNQYEQCWPAVQREAHGVIFVFNPDSAAQARQLDTFHQAFVQQAGGQQIPDTACVVFAHFLSQSQVRGLA